MKATQRIRITATSGACWIVTDCNAKARSEIINLGPRKFACRIDRYGKPWKYMVVTGTDNLHSVYEMTFQVGERYINGELPSLQAA